MMGNLRLCVESHLAVNLSNRLIDDIQQHLPAGGSMRTIQKKNTHISFRGHFIWIKSDAQQILRDCWVGESHPNPSFATVICVGGTRRSKLSPRPGKKNHTWNLRCSPNLHDFGFVRRSFSKGVTNGRNPTGKDHVPTTMAFLGRTC